MANRDGTGPNGQGRLTGRGMGPCGRGQRRGFFGRFFRRNITKEEEKAELKAEQEEINKRIKELE